MSYPAWLNPAIAGAVLGAGATVIFGFSQGGWYSTGSAERLADARSAAAVVNALVPVCVGQSKLDPTAAATIKKMATMITDYEKRDTVIKAGWATLSPVEGPNRDVAAACADVLVHSQQG